MSTLHDLPCAALPVAQVAKTMLAWLKEHLCLCHDHHDPERQPLTSDAFPSPSTILTAPRPRPAPLTGLPSLPHQRLHGYSAITPGSGGALGSPSKTSGDGKEGGVAAAGADSGKERMGGISRYYSQRMRPLTRSAMPTPSLPGTPVQLSSASQDPFAVYPTAPAPLQARTVPTSPSDPFNPLPGHFFKREHHPEPQISRSTSAPQILASHLEALRSARPPPPAHKLRTPEVEGFAGHQLPHGLSTDPRSVMIFRGRPRSATTLTVDRPSLAVTRSISDDGLPRAAGTGATDEAGGRGGAGLQWTGRRGRSPGPTRIGMSRTSIDLGIAARAKGESGSRSRLGNVGRPAGQRTSSVLSLRAAAPPAAPGDQGLVIENPDIHHQHGPDDPSSSVTQKELGLAELFSPLGHRQTRSQGSVSRRGGRGSSRSNRGKRILTG